MSPRKPRPTPLSLPPVFKTKSDSDPDSFASDLDRLYFHAEMHFLRQGGSKCAMCHAHVRHVVEVSSFRPEGKQVFPCLCTRCLVAEEARSSRVVLRFEGVAADSVRPASRRFAA